MYIIFICVYMCVMTCVSVLCVCVCVCVTTEHGMNRPSEVAGVY